MHSDQVTWDSLLSAVSTVSSLMLDLFWECPKVENTFAHTKTPLSRTVPESNSFLYYRCWYIPENIILKLLAKLDNILFVFILVLIKAISVDKYMTYSLPRMREMPYLEICAGVFQWPVSKWSWWWPSMSSCWTVWQGGLTAWTCVNRLLQCAKKILRTFILEAEDF